MAALAARFQFSAVSMEGRGFWIVRTGPIDAETFLWAKAWPGIVPMIVIGEVLAISSITILDSQSAMLWIELVPQLFGLGIIRTRRWNGRTLPRLQIGQCFKAGCKSCRYVVHGDGIGVGVCVLALEAAPVYYLITSQVQKATLTTNQLIITSVCLHGCGYIVHCCCNTTNQNRSQDFVEP